MRFIRTTVLPIFCLLAITWSWTVAAAEANLPRFVSLRADKVNVRAGPGVRYPINWIYLREGLPVEVIAEFELWRKIRDYEGTEGWVHKSLLSGRRTAIITRSTRTLYRRPGGTVPVLRAEAGVHGRLLACDGKWCRMGIAGTKGWLPRKAVWGVYASEIFD